ncbi:hypothetical protein Taro_037535 [Colocasia esculenta]|uniref:Uncharacterized protein n=1 Tax=Colocasia esculenta TaxID=4460 RepID=A0A843WBC6_COLES|nr:hypothetical protein [Colocasia esculenta]
MAAENSRPLVHHPPCSTPAPPFPSLGFGWVFMLFPSLGCSSFFASGLQEERRGGTRGAAASAERRREESAERGYLRGGFMSAGFTDLFLSAFPADLKKPLPLCASSAVSSTALLGFGTSSAPSSVVEAFPLALVSCMRSTGKGAETGSMRLPSLRCGFGVKYFGFLHMRRCGFLFLFLRGART